MMTAGVQFDPCSGVEDQDGHIYIWDGKHRLEAAIRDGSMLLVELEPGLKEEAEWKACSANKKHGLKRSNADIAKAVQDAITLHPEKSDREIALWVGCDHKTVGKYRARLHTSGEIPQMPTREITRGDQSYQMEIATPQPAKPRMTLETLKPRIKMFLQQEFPDFAEARAALEELCSPFLLQEPHKSLMRRLAEFIRIQYSDSKNVSIRDGCKAALEDWNALEDFREQMQEQTLITCDRCGKAFPRNQIVEHNGQNVHTDCYYAVLNEEDTPVKPQFAVKEASGEEPDMPAPESESEPKPEAEQEDTVCIFCDRRHLSIYRMKKRGMEYRGICRKCAQKALKELLDPKDPEIIEECIEQWKNSDGRI